MYILYHISTNIASISCNFTTKLFNYSSDSGWSVFGGDKKANTLQTKGLEGVFKQIKDDKGGKILNLRDECFNKKNI